MNNQPVLVVMAAGMGSRYGGLKQIDPVGENGEIIIDFSLFDAKRAGFRDVIFIIKKEVEQEFTEVIGKRIAKEFNVSYVFQEIGDLPQGFTVPQGRQKPWGTAHAVRACRNVLNNRPFAVINADDFYGAEAFSLIFQHLSKAAAESQQGNLAMVGYILENTLTDHGHVARGVCALKGDKLADIHERVRIERHEVGAQYTEDDGKTWVTIPKGSIVSMNLWGFTPMVMDALSDYFPQFLSNDAVSNPQKAEYFLPSVVDRLLNEGKGTVTVLTTNERWYGVTYREDKPVVVAAIAALREKGVYPNKLWEV